jgi:hypothetical protein
LFLCGDLLLLCWCWPLATYLLLLIACASLYRRRWREIAVVGIVGLFVCGPTSHTLLAMALAYQARLWPSFAIQLRGGTNPWLTLGLGSMLVGLIVAGGLSRRDWMESRGADRAGASLMLGFVPGADLRGAQLRNADLRWGCLKFARLSGADLTGANLAGVCLDGADLTGAVLTGADLTGAHYNDRTRWPSGFSLMGIGANCGAETTTDRKPMPAVVCRPHLQWVRVPEHAPRRRDV